MSGRLSRIREGVRGCQGSEKECEAVKDHDVYDWVDPEDGPEGKEIITQWVVCTSWQVQRGVTVQLEVQMSGTRHVSGAGLQ